MTGSCDDYCSADWLQIAIITHARRPSLPSLSSPPAGLPHLLIIQSIPSSSSWPSLPAVAKRLFRRMAIMVITWKRVGCITEVDLHRARLVPECVIRIRATWMCNQAPLSQLSFLPWAGRGRPNGDYGTRRTARYGRSALGNASSSSVVVDLQTIRLNFKQRRGG